MSASCRPLLDTETAAVPGVVQAVTPLLRRLTAPNPGMMTGPGTNSWIIGEREPLIVDPGPDDPEHIEHLAALVGGRLQGILVTHAHPDHAPGSARLARLTGAPVRAHPDAGVAGAQPLTDGDRVATAECSLQILHTPGHAAHHLCFLLEEEAVLLAGDQVMEGATVVIGPPDGDMRAYLDALERLKALPLRALAPGHGRLLAPPTEVLQRVIDHRLERERMVLAAVHAGERHIRAMVARIYASVPAPLHPVAERSVLAHLLKLADDGRVWMEPETGEWFPVAAKGREA